MKWSVLFSIFIIANASCVLSSSVKRNKSKNEDKNNSINYLYSEFINSPSSFISTMLHDATLPVFTIMGIASIASHLTNNGKDETSNGVVSRSRRSLSSSQSMQNLVKILNNVQKAIEQYSHIEDAILNDLDESVKREFDSKSTD